ncbi:hypothetical protein [Scopulibacillus darangshiensis]|nr:hypothetical protein [Scopulibacillus darangshiensis]
MFFDIYFILAAALVGGIIAIAGFIMIFAKKVKQPKEELQRKVALLEEEVKNLKSDNKR